MRPHRRLVAPMAAALLLLAGCNTEAGDTADDIGDGLVEPTEETETPAEDE